MKIKIGAKHTVIDMYMMVDYECTIHGFAIWKRRQHVILGKEERFSLGQIYWKVEKNENSLVLGFRSTSWHDSLDALQAYWDDKGKNDLKMSC